MVGRGKPNVPARRSPVGDSGREAMRSEARAGARAVEKPRRRWRSPVSIPRSSEGLKKPQLKDDESGRVLVNSAYDVRQHRDNVNAQVMADQRIEKTPGPGRMPFDGSEWGGAGSRV